MTPRAISTLVLWQWLTVFLGVVLTGLFLRFYGADWPDDPPYLPAYPRFVRNYGFWFCVLPLIWASVSVLSVGTLDALPQIKRRYTVAGYVLWAVLFVVFTVPVLRAYGDGLGYVVEENEGGRAYAESLDKK